MLSFNSSTKNRRILGLFGKRFVSSLYDKTSLSPKLSILFSFNEIAAKLLIFSAASYWFKANTICRNIFVILLNFIKELFWNKTQKFFSGSLKEYQRVIVIFSMFFFQVDNSLGLATMN